MDRFLKSWHFCHSLLIKMLTEITECKFFVTVGNLLPRCRSEDSRSPTAVFCTCSISAATGPIFFSYSTYNDYYKVVISMQLNETISKRLLELLAERNMTQYQLYIKSGIPKSTIRNVINCSYPSVKLRIIHEICQGLDIALYDFFKSPLFNNENLEP